MGLREALDYLNASTQFEAVMYFQIVADSPEDLDEISNAVREIGWLADVDSSNLAVRVARPWLTEAR